MAQDATRPLLETSNKLMRVTKRKTVAILGLASFVALTTSAPLEAASVTFESQWSVTGAGLGNVSTFLVLQKNDTETGTIAWSGSGDVVSGDAKPQSATWSVADLGTIGIGGDDASFGLVLNLNETSGRNDLALAALSVDFFDATGVVLFSAAFGCTACDTPLSLTVVEDRQGTGGAGLLFRVALSASERAIFFGTRDGRLGMSAGLDGTDGGPEGFYLVALPSLTIKPVEALTPNVVTPEPATLVLAGSGLLWLARDIRRRQRGRSAAARQ